MRHSLSFGMLLYLCITCIINIRGEVIECSNSDSPDSPELFNNSCANSVINCTDENEDCDVRCTDPESCQGATINCAAGSGYCYVVCEGPRACESITINCADNQFCDIDCSGEASCTNAYINGTTSSTLFVSCREDQACMNSTFDGRNSGDLQILDCDYPDACMGMTLYCPRNTIEAKCTISGDDNLGGSISHPMTLYLQDGWNDIYLSTETSNRMGMVYSGDDYRQCCSIAEGEHKDQWTCDNSVSVSCFDTTPPSQSPTEFPTNIPSSNPSEFPTQPPSQFPTPFPSTNPTKFPTTVPTKSPSTNPTTNFPTSANPTTFPSIIPSQSPTQFPTNIPSSNPSNFPTQPPSQFPTPFPSTNPTKFPTQSPSTNPTTVNPTISPTQGNEGGITETMESATVMPTSSPTGTISPPSPENYFDTPFGRASLVVIGFCVLLVGIGFWIYFKSDDSMPKNIRVNTESDDPYRRLSHDIETFKL